MAATQVVIQGRLHIAEIAGAVSRQRFLYVLVNNQIETYLKDLLFEPGETGRSQFGH